MRAKLLLSLLALPLCFGACTRQDSGAAREAEIERRVQERLEAEHLTAEKQQLAEHEAALAAREKTLAAERSSFASISAALPPSFAAPPPEDDNAPSDDGSGSYYSASGALYPDEQFGYLGADQPDLDYPYFGVSGIPILTTFVPYGRFSNYNYRRGFHNNRGWPHRNYPPANSRGGFARRPAMTAPARNFSYHPSFRSAPSRPPIIHSHATANRVVPQRAR